MLGRRRVFAMEPLGSRDGAGEDLARGCVVPGVTSVYRRIPDTVQGCSLDSWKGDGDQKATKAEVEEAEVVEGLGSEAWACLPGQGLRYLEHLCLVLEQMAKLQQLHLQLQTQKAPGGVSCGVVRPADGPNPIEAEEVLAPSPPPSHAPGSEVHGPWELLSQTTETGAKRASFPKVGVPSANLSRLSEAPAEPAHDFQSSQGHKDLSHWNKVKVLLNRIRWKSPRHPEPPVPPDGPGPRIESRDLPERSPCRPLRKTFMPSLVVKKQRAKNLSVC